MKLVITAMLIGFTVIAVAMLNAPRCKPGDDGLYLGGMLMVGCAPLVPGGGR